MAVEGKVQRRDARLEFAPDRDALEHLFHASHVVPHGPGGDGSESPLGERQIKRGSRLAPEHERRRALPGGAHRDERARRNGVHLQRQLGVPRATRLRIPVRQLAEFLERERPVAQPYRTLSVVPQHSRLVHFLGYALDEGPRLRRQRAEVLHVSLRLRKRLAKKRYRLLVVARPGVDTLGLDYLRIYRPSPVLQFSLVLLPRLLQLHLKFAKSVLEDARLLVGAGQQRVSVGRLELLYPRPQSADAVLPVAERHLRTVVGESLDLSDERIVLLGGGGVVPPVERAESHQDRDDSHAQDERRLASLGAAARQQLLQRRPYVAAVPVYRQYLPIHLYHAFHVPFRLVHLHQMLVVLHRLLTVLHVQRDVDQHLADFHVVRGQRHQSIEHLFRLGETVHAPVGPRHEQSFLNRGRTVLPLQIELQQFLMERELLRREFQRFLIQRERVLVGALLQQGVRQRGVFRGGLLVPAGLLVDLREAVSEHARRRQILENGSVHLYRGVYVSFASVLVGGRDHLLHRKRLEVVRLDERRQNLTRLELAFVALLRQVLHQFLAVHQIHDRLDVLRVDAEVAMHRRQFGVRVVHAQYDLHGRQHFVDHLPLVYAPRGLHDDAADVERYGPAQPRRIEKLALRLAGNEFELRVLPTEDVEYLFFYLVPHRAFYVLGRDYPHVDESLSYQLAGHLLPRQSHVQFHGSYLLFLQQHLAQTRILPVAGGQQTHAFLAEVDVHAPGTAHDGERPLLLVHGQGLEDIGEIYILKVAFQGQKRLSSTAQSH